MEYFKFIKMLDEHYGSENDMQNLLKYIAGKGGNINKEKLLQCCGKGVSSHPKKAAMQMKAVQQAFGKENGRRMYHLIVSFPKNMHQKAFIKQAADEVAEMFFENFQVFYGIHTAKEHWHIHYAVNAVSYRTGKKWHQNKQEFACMKKAIQEIAENAAKGNSF